MSEKEEHITKLCDTDLIVETAFTIQEVEELRVSLVQFDIQFSTLRPQF